MNKVKNRIILSFILGMIVASTITVTAITLSAKEVTYSPKNQNFKVNNTDDALNYLYKLTDYEVPANTYFYDKNNVGKDIKRYKKINNEYFSCDEHGKVTSNNPMSVNEKNLVEYKGTTSANLSAGTAGYANKNFMLGEMQEQAISTVFDLTLVPLPSPHEGGWEGTSSSQSSNVQIDIRNYKHLKLNVHDSYNRLYIKIDGNLVKEYPLYAEGPFEMDISNNSTLLIYTTMDTNLNRVRCHVELN